jgi:casein kinase I homolog HRR25
MIPLFIGLLVCQSKVIHKLANRSAHNNNSKIRYITMSNPKFNVGTNYSLIKHIGKGSFGEVYLVADKEGTKYACKAEKNNAKNRLKGESHIYKRFAAKNLNCVPTIHKYMETPEYNLLIMQLLGNSLDMIFEDCHNNIDIGTVMKLAINIIDNLEKIHRTGIIHRDIKPNNFMFGVDEHKNDLYVMDFGLSKKWYVDGNHIEFKTGRSMIGTARYASLNIHLGTEPSRRDDMESVGYMLIYLIKGSLPWQGLKKKSKENSMDKIGEKKMLVNLETLCEGLPDCFYKYINYTRNLQFTEKPDYEYLKDLFIKSAETNGIDIKYYWEKKKFDGQLNGRVPGIHFKQDITSKFRQGGNIGISGKHTCKMHRHDASFEGSWVCPDKKNATKTLPETNNGFRQKSGLAGYQRKKITDLENDVDILNNKNSQTVNRTEKTKTMTMTKQCKCPCAHDSCRAMDRSGKFDKK